jgi:cellobiose phosphorylase
VGFEATRIFRGVNYHITVERAGEGNTVSLTVDGQPVDGDIVPLPLPGTDEVVVKAVLT